MAGNDKEFVGEGFFFSCKDLCVGYDKVPLISGITVGIRRGEILTLIGPNGSGKSTILKSITKQLALLGGTVYLDRTDLAALPARNRARQLAVVLTDRIRPELMTVGELVSAGRYPYTGYFGRLTAQDKQIVRESLERVHALDLSDRDFNSLSDGQRQRVMLARALCQQPEIIVLDEPTSFLDIRHKTELLDILGAMAKKNGITVVMSLHEIDLAAKISDQVMCVKGDRIFKIGSPEEIFTDSMIAELYELKKGRYDALFGSTELILDAEGDARVFVVGGNGSGIPYFRLLQRYGVPFCAGILFENDVDYHVCRNLASSVMVCPPFSFPGEDAVKEAEQSMLRCEYVVDCGCVAGELNAANVQLLKTAEERGMRILRSTRELTEIFGA